MANKFPNDPILRYALVTLASEPNATYDWEIYQNLLIQIYRSQPQVSHLITHELLLYTEIQRKTLNKQLLAKAISDHILRYARTRASNEVAWAMWLAILFNLKLGQEVTDTISSSTDNFVAILAMDADSRGLFDKPIDSSLWERKLLEENIYTEDWLLVYEIPAQGWTRVQDSSDYINQHQCFGKLHSANVYFYDGKIYSKTDDILHKLQINREFYAA